MRRAAWIIGFIAVQAACIWVVQPDLGRLWAGLPRLAGWIAGGFPPDFSGFGDLAARSAETLALATLGEALPCCMVVRAISAVSFSLRLSTRIWPMKSRPPDAMA